MRLQEYGKCMDWAGGEENLGSGNKTLSAAFSKEKTTDGSKAWNPRKLGY